MVDPALIVGQESPSKNTQILYRRSRKVSNAISTVVNIHSSRNRRARFALERKIRRDNKRLGRSTIMVDDHRVTLVRRLMAGEGAHCIGGGLSPLPLPLATGLAGLQTCQLDRIQPVLISAARLILWSDT